MKRALLIFALLCGSAFAQTYYGVPANAGTTPDWVGSTLYQPSQYGTFSISGYGMNNAVSDPDFGTPIGKICDMCDVGASEPFSADDQYIMVNVIVDNQSGYGWFGRNGARIRRVDTGALICDIETPNRSTTLWGTKDVTHTANGHAWSDKDTLWLITKQAGNVQIGRINVPVCEAATRANASFKVDGITKTSPQGDVADVWDTITGHLDTNGDVYVVKDDVGSFCSTSEVSPVDSDHLCIGSESGGSKVWDPRLYSITAKTIGPPLATDAEQAYAYRRSGRMSLKTATDMVIPYVVTNPSNGVRLALYDGVTGAQKAIISAGYWGHADTLYYNGGEYGLTSLGSTDPYRPDPWSTCWAAMAFGLMDFANPTNTEVCTLNRFAGEPYVAGQPTEVNHLPYVLISAADFTYSTPMVSTFASRTGSTALIIDAATAGDCSSGGGTAWAFCAKDQNGVWQNGSNIAYPTSVNYASTWNSGWHGEIDQPGHSAYLAGTYNRIFANEIAMVPLDGSAPRHLAYHRTQNVEFWYANQAWGKKGVMSCTSGACAYVSGDQFVTNSHFVNGAGIYFVDVPVQKTISTINSATALTLTDATYSGTNLKWYYVPSIVPYESGVGVKASWSGKYAAFRSTFGGNNTIGTYVVQIASSDPVQAPATNSGIKVCTH